MKMKKLMIAAAAALWATVGMADIESANVVGYQNKSLDKGKFYILGVQFEGMDGTMDINQLVSGLTGVEADEDGLFTKTAAQMQVPNAKGTYDIYYYLTNGWFDNGTEDGDFKPGWCDSNGVIAGEDDADLDGQLTAGLSAWVKGVGAAETFVQAGQVPLDDSVEVQAPAKFALRANVYPIAFNLNDADKVSYSGLTAGDIDDDNFVNTASQIQVPNAKGTYDVYYYLSNGWYDNGTEDGGYKAGWCDSNGVIAGDAESDLTGDVPAGQGF